MNELIKFWSEMNLKQGPYIHPKDKNLLLDLSYSYKGLTDYYENKYWNNKGVFHTDLIPVPYVGDLKNAKIFILLLNPGFSFLDYYAEESSTSFVNSLKSNLKQDFKNSNYPFLYLKPDLMWTGGSQYWLGKLKYYIQQIKDKKQCSNIEATQYLSKRVAVLELIPYHSVNFTHHSLLNKLESVKVMRKFIDNYIKPKAEKNKAGIICIRQAKKWGIQTDNNIIVYKNSETRSAHLSEKSSAFPIFQKFLMD